MRAVVLARGLGTRMRSADSSVRLTDAQQRAADEGLKAMMPIGGRPFLDFLLSALGDAGISHVAIVVGPDHELARGYYRVTAPPARIDVDFVVQREPLGTADAVLAAETWVHNEAFLVTNGDNLYPADALRALASLDEPGLTGFDREALLTSSNIEPERIRAFALVEPDEEGYLKRIVEKPGPDDVGPGALVSMNCWRFDGRIFDACRGVPLSPRGEYELPSAAALAMERGLRFKVVRARGPVLDLSHRADAAELSRRLAGVRPRP